MLGDPDSGSVYDRLWELVRERFAVLFPLWVIEQPETLTIIDYRPTFSMFLTALGFVILAISVVLFFFNVDSGLSLGLWAIGVPAATFFFLLFRGTIREVYYFDKTSDSYSFTRQFIHRREIIEGAMSQFTDASVKTVEDEENSSYYVILKQEGMFLTGVSEQTLREEVPLFNTFDREARIANAISGFIHSKR